MWMIAANYWWLTAEVDWLGLRVGRHPALSLHWSDEPGELSQWLWSWWQHHKHCHGYYYYYYYLLRAAVRTNNSNYNTSLPGWRFLSRINSIKITCHGDWITYVHKAYMCEVRRWYRTSGVSWRPEICPLGNGDATFTCWTSDTTLHFMQCLPADVITTSTTLPNNASSFGTST